MRLHLLGTSVASGLVEMPACGKYVLLSIRGKVKADKLIFREIEVSVGLCITIYLGFFLHACAHLGVLLSVCESAAELISRPYLCIYAIALPWMSPLDYLIRR
jgi:hypothetical protein